MWPRFDSPTRRHMWAEFVLTKFVLTAFNGQLFIIVRNRLPPLSIAPRTARFIGYIVRNKETFLLQIKILFCSYSDCVVYTKPIIHLSAGESGGYLPRRVAAR